MGKDNLQDGMHLLFSFSRKMKVLSIRQILSLVYDVNVVFNVEKENKMLQKSPLLCGLFCRNKMGYLFIYIKSIHESSSKVAAFEILVLHKLHL